MRYLTVLVKPESRDAFHPLGKRLTEAPSVERRAIHHVELLADGTVLLFAEASGSQERYRQIMENAPRVIDYLVSGDDPWMAVSNFEPTESSRRTLELQRESPLVIETPMRFTDDGGIKLTCLGTDEAFGELFGVGVERASVSVELLEMGDFEPDKSTFSRTLTPRQEEVLEAAVQLGYYDVPREASLRDVGEAVGITPSTAGEHLRKVEQRVFNELVC
ncbi:helix-turn-helix domain-containing protein [Haloferax denitrificans]|uniref:DNA binding protein n=1 Tax=Haloferax denitrificans ATCC 35960 TaxID=662478 RepID=M0JH90_9EURY|nr:helix-turn-helix domain-containing protein [Haloferax denitrificans]EMA08366.1 DNA binding protein [Haloferax denitrificans ATCC 35960]